MAEKEATIFVIDLAKSMGKKENGRDLNNLDWSLQYVWDKITQTVLLGRKIDQIGIVGLGTDETKNDMQDEGYENISIIQPISQILMPQLKELSSVLKPSQTEKRDVLSSIIIAVDMMIKHCRHLQYKKKIVVITNATAKIDDDDIEATARQIQDHNIDLTILGIDLEGKNKDILDHLTSECNGVLATMEEAIEDMARPHIKSVRSIPTFTGQLKLGDPEHYDTALTIDVQRFFRTSIRKPPTATSFAIKQGQTDLTSIHNTFRYTVENGQDIAREDLAKGYEYGRTAVYISETDQNITILETQASYEILGFVPAENIERYMIMENSNIIVASKANDKAVFALSSLIHALYELESVAIGRFTKKDMSEPILTLLSPLIEEDIECLVENVLPFAEDLRSYKFAPIDKILTVTGKEVKEHRNLPGPDLNQSMNDWVDDMMLSEFNMEDYYSPVLHGIEDAIKYKAVHPDEPIPKSESFVYRPAKIDPASLSRLIDDAEIKRVPPKVKGRKRLEEKPLSGLNVDDLFRKKAKISSDNAIPEFKQQLSLTENIDQVKNLVREMAGIITNTNQSKDLIIEELGVIKQEMMDLEEPSIYSDLLAEIKDKLPAGVWRQVR